MKKGLIYAHSGVDIDAGNQAVNLIRPIAQSTFRPEVLSNLGGFSGLFALDPARYQKPVLVASTDGVGTKLKVAVLMNHHSSIGIDAVAMCVNDILVQGAEPLFFLDYLAVGKLVPEKVATIVAGVAEGCRQAGCALLGGETAEMPGIYSPEEYDLAGFVVGVVEQAKIINGSGIKPGNQVIGLPSSGLHSNGYSLARKVLLEVAGYQVDTCHPALGRTVGEEMLVPTRIYVPLVLSLLEKTNFNILGMVNITGGALRENIPRILPPGCTVVLKKQSWPIPPIFSLIQEIGRIKEAEMQRVFNLGLGFLLIVPGEEAPSLLSYFTKQKEKAYLVGEVISGHGEVVFV
jgi:phosphoribosylformylglycinamidine cyclo-ligase